MVMPKPTKPFIAKADVAAGLVHLRDGCVVLYRRTHSQRWQTRYKLDDGRWRRKSTKHTNADYAAQVACDAYDRARFLRDENLPVDTKRFEAVAMLAVNDMLAQQNAGGGKSVYASYITALRVYLVPFFGKHNINTIGYAKLCEFDAWRRVKMGKQPTKSTVTTHNSALNRVFDEAVKRGWLAESQRPQAPNTGVQGKARDTFSKQEYQQLTSYMVRWSATGHTEKTRQMRQLLRDYVLILATTGIRHGTEAMNLRWRDIEWATREGER